MEAWTAGTELLVLLASLLLDSCAFHLTSMTRTATEALGRVSIVRSGGRLCLDGLAYATSASTRIYSPVSRCLRRPILCFCSVLVVLVCHVMLSRFNKLGHSKKWRWLHPFYLLEPDFFPF